MTQVLVETSQ